MSPVVVVGGVFTTAGTVAANNIATYDPATGAWAALGSGMSSGPGNNAVRALAVLPNGNLVAGGDFFSAGGVSASCIASWNGTVWAPLGTGMAGNPFAGLGVYALETTNSGNLIAGGVFAGAGGSSISNIARWNGTTWSALGSGLNSAASSLARLTNGDIVAGGQITVAGGLPVNWIARWNGSAWSALGTGTANRVHRLHVLSNGDLIACESSPLAGTPTIERWNGLAWSPLGPVTTDLWFALAELPGGDLVGAGWSTAPRVARWNGASWVPLTTAVGGSFPSFQSLAMLPDGRVALGGSFSSVGSVVANNLAALTTTCPASVTSVGSGCVGSGGLNVLIATSLPWTGSAFRAAATGMPAFAFVLAVTGFTTISVPLPLIFPQGVPGCVARVNPDLIDVLLPVAGTAQSQLALPNTPALAGMVFHHQIVPIEVDLSFAITAVTSTNALTLTIGIF